MSVLIDELELLLFEWESGSLAEDGVQRVREILRSDIDAQRFFAQQQTLNAALHLESVSGLQSSNDNREANKLINHWPPGDSQTAQRRHVLAWSSAAAIILIASLVGRIAYLEVNSGDSNRVVNLESGLENPIEEISHGVAIITQLVDVEWADNQQAHENGDSLSLGPLAIKSGYAQVEFLCGATLIIEGPAALDLKSATLAKVISGRLRAQVPPAARGFSLEVDGMKVVDLGTEFGLSVSAERANVQVFDGEVELQNASEPKQLMLAGESVVRTQAGEYQRAEMTPDRFLSISELESRVQGQQDQRYDCWRNWSNTISTDPRLIAYYAFDQSGNWQRKLTNSLQPPNSELDGAIVGASRVPGRWSGKSGLEFRRPGDRVRVQIPGEFGSLTFLCWVKIDSLDRMYNSLFLTDHYDLGEPHWQILHTGQLYFSVRPSSQVEVGPRDFKALSPPFWDATLSGRWIQLATVYSVESSSIAHYLNGSLLSEHSVPPEKMVPTRIGIASIGNWASPTQSNAGFAIRNLNGSIDELAIFSAALTAAQIRDIYDQSKP